MKYIDIKRIDLENIEYYPGDYIGADGLFPLEQFIECQKHLVAASVIMKMLGMKYNMRYIENIRGYFPARILEKRKSFTIQQLHLLLNSNYFNDNILFYELNSIIAKRNFGLFGHSPTLKRIATYSVKQMDDRALLLEDIEKTIHSWK